MKSLPDVKFSTLDLVPVRANGSPAQSLRNSLDLAQHVEKFGYHRFWVAEHHNMDDIASSATSVLLGYLAGGTSTIPLVAADTDEQADYLATSVCSARPDRLKH